MEKEFTDNIDIDEFKYKEECETILQIYYGWQAALKEYENLKAEIKNYEYKITSAGIMADKKKELLKARERWIPGIVMYVKKKQSPMVLRSEEPLHMPSLGLLERPATPTGPPGEDTPPNCIHVFQTAMGVGEPILYPILPQSTYRKLMKTLKSYLELVETQTTYTTKYIKLLEIQNTHIRRKEEVKTLKAQKKEDISILRKLTKRRKPLFYEYRRVQQDKEWLMQRFGERDDVRKYFEQRERLLRIAMNENYGSLDKIL